MTKRYKKGNKRKKKKSNINVFYEREKKLNKLISKFINDYFELQYPALDEEYDEMNRQRLEIKRLFELQEADLYRQSRRRKYFYYKQLNKFKYYYVAWKHLTYYIYLSRRYDVPVHLSKALSFYKKNTHDIVSTIYRL